MHDSNERSRTNRLGQPIGSSVDDWTPPRVPPRLAIDGTWVRLEPLVPEDHATVLFESFSHVNGRSVWTYLGYGPFDSLQAYRDWMEKFCTTTDPLFFAVKSKGGRPRALGTISYLRISPDAGSIEVGHLCFSPALQKTTMATEAVFLLMKQAFELGYRRFEWKCDSLNRASCRAALRLGFRYEGTFRQATVYKNRNRDTSWFSVIDREWPVLRARFESWLDPRNFDSDGVQRLRLEAIR